jgi:hypothetical protein
VYIAEPDVSGVYIVSNFREEYAKQEASRNRRKAVKWFSRRFGP